MAVVLEYDRVFSAKFIMPNSAKDCAVLLVAEPPQDLLFRIAPLEHLCGGSGEK
jgi:hypothetical protein